MHLRRHTGLVEAEPLGLTYCPHTLAIPCMGLMLWGAAPSPTLKVRGSLDQEHVGAGSSDATWLCTPNELRGFFQKGLLGGSRTLSLFFPTWVQASLVD